MPWAIVLVAGTARAQAPRTPVPPAAPASALAASDSVGRGDRSTARDRRLLTPGELWTVGAFAAGTALAAPFDRRLAGEFEEPETHRSRAVARTASAFRSLGDPGALVLTAGAYAAGRLTHRRGLADAGLHATEAVLVSGVTTAAIKVLVGRARPYTVAGRDPDEFRVGRGGGGRASFPLGHTTVAFAAAAAVSAEAARSGFARRHPAAARAVAPLLFGSAAAVGVSRMYHDAHWASDVVAGAGIGAVAGHAVVRFQHARPRGRIEQWLLPVTVAPLPGGAAIRWSGTFR